MIKRRQPIRTFYIIFTVHRICHVARNTPCGFCLRFWSILYTGVLTCNRKYLNQSERFISLQHTSKLPMIMWAVKTLLTDRFGIFSLSIFGWKKLLACMDLYVCCFTGPQPILIGHVLQSDVNVEPWCTRRWRHFLAQGYALCTRLPSDKQWRTTNLVCVILQVFAVVLR